MSMHRSTSHYNRYAHYTQSRQPIVAYFKVLPKPSPWKIEKNEQSYSLQPTKRLKYVSVDRYHKCVFKTGGQFMGSMTTLLNSFHTELSHCFPDCLKSHLASNKLSRRTLNMTFPGRLCFQQRSGRLTAY